MSASEQVRAYVTEHYILPARRSGSTMVKVRAGDVHRALKWDLRRVPQVCAALSTRKFLRSAKLELVERNGPPSGQSTTVEFTYRLLDESEASSHPQHAPAVQRRADGSGLEELYGIFEDEFKALGGSDAFLEAERNAWGADPWEKLARDHRDRAENAK